ncbi:MAG: AEC family transporter, partial [Gallionella sp.]
ALLAALILIPVDYADWFSQLLKRLGDTLAPLALLSVGLQLRLGDFASVRRNVLLGVSFKLLLAPLGIYLLYVQLLGAHGQAMQITIFEAAMPPMITAAIIASEHHLDVKLANLMVAIGLLISFVSLSIWYGLLQSV